ncbi:MAG: PEGA domain-containing protein [Tepidisphaeraceae bacterium]
MKRPAILLSILLLTATGCVQRKLTITSEPSGALVYMNDREVGRTPIETDFTWYGTYDVQVRKEGYTTLDQPTRIPYPWWQIPPIDLFAELMPWHPTDRQKWHFDLQPRPSDDRPVDDVVSRGVDLGKQLENTRVPSTQPTTQKTATTVKP